MAEAFEPGEDVIWLKRVAGEFVFPFRAKVLAVTAKRVKILAEDPDEGDSGPVVRYVAPETLQRHTESESVLRRGGSKCSSSQIRRHRK